MRPRWMTAVGVLGIIFGCLGTMTAAQVFFMPMVLEMQRKLFAAMAGQAAQQPGSDEVFKGFAELFATLWGPLPSWFNAWSIALGLLSLIIAGAYVFGAIWLLLMKPSGPRIFCTGLVASIAAACLRGLGLVLAIGPMGLAMGMGGMFGVVLDVVLLIVVLAHKREWPTARSPSPTPAV